MIRQACSIHEPLAAMAGAGKVLSSHRHAVNLALDDGTLVSVLHPSLGNGPGAVLVPGVWSLAWTPGERVTLTGQVLRGPGCAIQLEGAALWAPPKPPRPPGPTAPGAARVADAARVAGAAREAGETLARIGNPAGLLPAALAALGLPGPEGSPLSPGGPPAGPVAAALRRMGLQGIRSLLAGDWETGVRRLAGLGPGSTPSGDDLLCGFTCTLVRAGHPAASAQGDVIRRIPPGATTALSRHLLHWAAEGVAGEHALAFVDALLRGEAAESVRLLRSLLNHGATSGSDWASGAMLAFYTLGREVSRSEAV